MYKGRAEPVLVSLSVSYFEDDSISVCDSRLLFVLPTQLLTTSDYCPNRMVNNFGLRRLFYSKRCFKNDCYSSA